jgi:aspartate aminotransferase
MNGETIETKKDLRVSQVAETLTGSEIIRLAGEINERIRKGEKIFNLTIGDFNPKIFPIPEELKNNIVSAYDDGQTNYPPAEGILDLRQAVSHFLNRKAGLDYKADQIIIAAGARPLIYATFKTLVDPKDEVVFPVPSWNNNHYSHLMMGRRVEIETRLENNFMPTARELKPYLKNAVLVSLCSPLNPTGTAFSKEQLEEICHLILEENRRRSSGEKPLYLLYDQIYWTLTFGDTKHYNPVSLCPEIGDYTIFIDGISKAFAATGVRVGWTFGPQKIMDKMKSILGHMGAWAPKAEQFATAQYLLQDEQVDRYLEDIRKKVNDRLFLFYKGFKGLKQEGFRVNAISPQAAIYLAVQLNLHGLATADGRILSSTKEITRYVLDEARLALVPFYAFGSSPDSSWYRISVGTCKLEEVDGIISNLRNALKKLS